MALPAAMALQSSPRRAACAAKLLSSGRAQPNSVAQSKMQTGQGIFIALRTASQARPVPL
jgi:hypothetical protein